MVEIGNIIINRGRNELRRICVNSFLKRYFNIIVFYSNRTLKLAKARDNKPTSIAMRTISSK